MAKVLLVEDDNNLREIYEARLQAEGYDIVSASDGEQALVVAKDAKPDLVISDVMMPKISGFEMLDILRNTDGMQDVKVIMLTALGQGEDKDRADQLGADKYLVKSQVTLEDIVGTAHQLLDDAPAPAPADPAASDGTASPVAAPSEPAAITTPTPAPTEPVAAAAPEPATPTDSTPSAAVPEPVATAPVAEPPMAPTAASAASSPVSDEAVSEADEQATMQQQINDFANQPATAAKEVTPAPAAPAEEAAVPSASESTAATEPAATSTASTDQQHDQILNEAVNSLNAATGNTEPATAPAIPAKPSDVTAVEVPAEPAAAPSTPPAAPVATEPTAAPAPTPDPAATVTPAAEPAQSSAAPSGDGVAIAGKKVIQPLSGTATDATGAGKPDLNELLAREEAKTPTPTEPAAPAEQQPSAPTTPAPTAPAANNTVDPNSIAL